MEALASSFSVLSVGGRMAAPRAGCSGRGAMLGSRQALNGAAVLSAGRRSGAVYARARSVSTKAAATEVWRGPLGFSAAGRARW